MQVELIKRIKESKDLYSFIFKPEKEIHWEPGQFIFYKIPHKNPDSRGIKRHFTISSAPFEKNLMLTTEFDFKNGSSFKRALYNLELGSRIEAFNIRGKLVVKDTNRRLVFIAGGIGITPYRSILLSLVHKGISANITMFYCNKNEDIIFKDILDKLEINNDWLDINYIIEPQLIDRDIIKRNISDIYHCIYYISGPLKMVKVVKNILLGMKIDQKDILVDYFSGLAD